MNLIERSKEIRKKNILITDDDPAVLAALQNMLAAEEFNVLPASNRREALVRISESPIDIALLDLHSSDNESGWGTFKHLSELQPLLPIVVMSARPEQFSSRPEVLRPPDATFEKPLLNMACLVETLRRLASNNKNPSVA